MEKLTIEQLAVYLPYKPEILLNTEGVFNLDSEGIIPHQAYKPLIITNFNFYDGSIEVEAEHKSGWGVGYIEQTEYNLLLHPISMLTKEITHGGRTFTPIEELSKYVEIPENSNNGGELIFSLQFDEGVFYILVEDFFYTGDGIKKYKDVVPNQFQLFQKLAEWHFNFIGIPEELFINKAEYGNR